MRWLLAVLTGLVLLGCASAPVSTAPDLSRPSVADTEAIEFAGKRLELRFRSKQKVVPVFEYYLPGEATDRWSELVAFRVYPVHPDGNEPMDHAARTAKLFKQQYPYMQFALYSDRNTGAALLDFFYPTSTRKDGYFLEFNAFKFFRDAGTPNIMSFHYARNIPGDREREHVLADIKAIRAEILPAIAKLPLYRQ
jgi:hypothetical protein